MSVVAVPLQCDVPSTERLGVPGSRVLSAFVGYVRMLT